MQADVTIGCGLFNLGNSCFFNSFFQALFHLPKMVDYLQSELDKAVITKCTMKGKMKKKILANKVKSPFCRSHLYHMRGFDALQKFKNESVAM